MKTALACPFQLLESPNRSKKLLLTLWFRKNKIRKSKKNKIQACLELNIKILIFSEHCFKIKSNLINLLIPKKNNNNSDIDIYI